MQKGAKVKWSYIYLLFATIVLFATIAGFSLLLIYKGEVDAWLDQRKTCVGSLLFSAWTSTGIYLARFAFTTLLLASFIEPVVKRFVEPHKRVLADVRAWLVQDFAAFDKENVSRDFSNYFEDCKADIEYQEQQIDAAVEQVIQSSYPVCFFGALIALSFTLLGIDNFAGPFSLALMWPMAYIWWKCRGAWVVAEKESEEVRAGFRRFTAKYRKRLDQDNKSYTDKLKVEYNTP